jgi:hypothetical protein
MHIEREGCPSSASANPILLLDIIGGKVRSERFFSLAVTYSTLRAHAAAAGRFAGGREALF